MFTNVLAQSKFIGAMDTDINVTASTSTAYATSSLSSAGHVTTNSLLNIFSSEQLQQQNSSPLETDRNSCGIPLGNSNGDLVMSHNQYQQFLQQYMNGLVVNQSPSTRESPDQVGINESLRSQDSSTSSPIISQRLIAGSPLHNSRPSSDLPKTINASSMLRESFGLSGVPLSSTAPAPSSSPNTFGESLIMATTTMTPQSTVIPTLTDGVAGEVETVAANIGNGSDVYLAACAPYGSSDTSANSSDFPLRPLSVSAVESNENTGTVTDSDSQSDDRPPSEQPDSSGAAEPASTASETVPSMSEAQPTDQPPSRGTGNGGDSRKSSASDTSASRSSAPGETEQSLLIKKQMTEMEKEFSRRFNNKNFKKIDEAELAQWFSDHGFPSIVAAPSFNGSAATEASLPYCPPTAENVNQQAARPTLDQLRSSFSPPEAPPQGANGVNFGYPSVPIKGFYDAYGNFIPQPAASFQAAMMQINPQLHSICALTDSFPQVSQTQNLGATLTGGGLGLHGPAAFLTSPVLPQHSQPASAAGAPIGRVDIAKAAANGAALRFETHVPGGYPAYAGGMAPSTTANYTQQMPAYFNGFPPQFYQPPHPQQFGATNSGPSPSQQSPYSTIMSPTMSNISSEMAAVLLQQIQQDNPGLIENLVDQQQRNRSNQATPSSTSAGAINNGSSTNEAPKPPSGRLPAPPPPQNGIARGAQKHSVIGNPQSSSREDENGWQELGKRHSVDSTGENKENGAEPIWVMRESYLKRLEREERRNQEHLGEVASSSNPNANQQTVPIADGSTNGANEMDELDETEKLLRDGTGACGGQQHPRNSIDDGKGAKTAPSTPNSKKEVMVHEPAVLIEGVLFRARYLGSTQMTTDGRPTKTSRMVQAQEAVARVKAPSGEIQPSTEIDLFISTEKIMVLNTDLQRISETDVRQDILMDHSLRSISYIADIGDLVVLMARRVPPIDAAAAAVGDDESVEGVIQTPRVVCHVFESEEASFIAQSIGQAFQVAYVEYLRANGIDDPAYLREVDYQEVLNSQELMGEELAMFARKETQKDIVIPKKVGEPLGIVVVESGWGSILPTVVVANMAPGGPASRSNQLNIGDQIIGINGISLVGLPLATAQQNIKNAKTSTAVRLTIVSTPPVVEVRIKRPNTKYQLGFSVQNGVICSLLRGGIAERGGIRVGHRIIEINQQSVVAVAHDRIVNLLATATGEIHMKTMPTSMFRLLTGQEVPNYI